VDFKYTPLHSHHETAEMPSSTRERLTEAALRRFYRDGFRNVGLDQILADVGISKTAFYKHFESKDALMLAVLEMKNVWLQDLLRTTILQRNDVTPVERLRSLFDIVQQFIDSDDFQGCIFVNVAMEFPLQHEPAHLAAAEHKRAIEALVCELASQAGADDPTSLAQELCLVMEGAYVTRHVTGDPRAAAVGRRITDQLIEKHIAHAATPTAEPVA
jgi:AcrR family transcriptional regulator